MPRPLYAPPLLGAGLAQMVEHLICNQRVRGSSPLTGTNFSIEINELIDHKALGLRAYFF